MSGGKRSLDMKARVEGGKEVALNGVKAALKGYWAGVQPSVCAAKRSSGVPDQKEVIIVDKIRVEVIVYPPASPEEVKRIARHVSELHGCEVDCHSLYPAPHPATLDTRYFGILTSPIR